MTTTSIIKKILSANDTGETGTHQVGILVPKQKEILDYFPQLDVNEKNPRLNVTFRDKTGDRWTFAFIYYNNIYFGGTRNEYRLTRMTSFIRMQNLKSGDELIFSRGESGSRHIGYRRANQPVLNDDGVLKLRGGWKIINY